MLALAIFVTGAVVGLLGGMLGVGGGVFLIPVLTLFFHVPIKVAIGASIVSVIATSSAAGAVYVNAGLAHTRLSMVLEIATTLGAMAGGITAVLVSARVLESIFALMLLYVAWSMYGLRLRAHQTSQPTGLLDTEYADPGSGTIIRYGVRRLRTGLGASFIAGNLSGLLGIGGGVIKVPIMTLVMDVPLKAAIATSNFMIGVTAATSAIIYYARGYTIPAVAVPTALGVLVGAQFGPRLAGRASVRTLRWVFIVVLLALALQMGARGLFGWRL